jgi:hypothetical protein
MAVSCGDSDLDRDPARAADRLVGTIERHTPESSPVGLDAIDFSDLGVVLRWLARAIIDRPN